MTRMIQVQIVGLRFDPIGDTSVVVLGESERLTRVLPILIGPTEAQSIASALTGESPQRPGTHDLATALMAVSGSRVEELVVTELTDGVFLAELFVEGGDGLQSVSARPSDGIALAIRVVAPIFVCSSVWDEAGQTIEREQSLPLSDEEIDRVVKEFVEFLDSARPSDFD